MGHIHEKIDWTTGVYIVYKDKVLLRLHEKYHMWVHVGGHVELDEDLVTAAIRECKEEVGLDIKIYDRQLDAEPMEPHAHYLPTPMHMNIHYVGGTQHQHIDLIYYAAAASDEVVPENEDDQWQWLTRAGIEAAEHISPMIKHYALGALDALGKK